MTDVIDGGINFSHPELQAAQATKSEESTSQTKPATEEQASTAATAKKWAGKYVSPEELERGYLNSAQEAQRILAENKALKEALMQGRVNPAQRMEERRNFAKELEEAAVPVDALDGLIKERLGTALREAFEPLARGGAARKAVSREFPNFIKNEDAIEEFLSANPELNDEYQRMLQAGLERAAFRYANLEFERNAGSKQVVDASGQEQAVARATASLTGTQAGTREVVDAQVKKLAEAQAEFDRTGDEKQYASVLFEAFRPFQVPQ